MEKGEGEMTKLLGSSTPLILLGITPCLAECVPLSGTVGARHKGRVFILPNGYGKGPTKAD